MAYNEPLAFMFTWTTYGSRLHGDERGTVDAEHNRYGAPFIPPSYRYVNLRRHDLGEEPLILDASMRGAVDRSIAQHADFRGWHLYAKNVRTNHVHVVVVAADKPGKVLGQFKAYATRALREAGLITGRKKVWTEDGSKRWLFTEEALSIACAYVIESQGPDLPMI